MTERAPEPSPAVAAADDPPRDPPADPREPLGRLAHETRLAHEADQAAAEGRERFLLGSWEERSDAQRELDMRMASAVAARAVKDAGLVNERKDAQLFALSAHLPAILDALRFAEVHAEAEVAAGGDTAGVKRIRAALEALGGEEEP